jgi:enoyl-CoA hydratase
MSTLIYTVDGPVALLTLNRPEKLNAVSNQMVAELNAALDRAESDEAIRVIVLNGAGRAFSAGFDLDTGEEGSGRDVDALRRMLRRDFDVIMRFWHSPKPTLAAVHGYCLGSGMEMALACDLTIAGSGCRFGAPEVQFGSGIITMIIPWLVGAKFAKELLMVGDDHVGAERALAMGLVNRVVAEEAVLDATLAMGLVNRVVAEEAVLDATLAMARDIAANGRLAVALTKQAINRSYDIMGMRQAMEQALELDVIVEASDTPESRAFYDMVASQGAKAAIAWRRARILNSSEGVNP